MKKSFGLLSAALLSVVVVGCSDSASPTAPSSVTGDMVSSTPAVPNSPASKPTIAAIASANPDFSTLVAALVKANLVGTFNGGGQFTVFAPTNASFDAAAAALLGSGKTGMDLVDALDVATLTAILKFHVVGDSRNAQTVLSAPQLRMLDGNTAAISLKGGSPYIENAKIIATDIEASNGTVHVIDGVLLPPGVAKTDRELQPTIAAIAVGNPDFSTLVAALQKAGLVETFNGKQQFTVFAPTNAAFDDAARLLHYRSGEELVAELDVKTLTAVLTYHVLVGDLDGKSVVAADNLRMFDGNWADVSVRQGQVFIDDAKILKTDIVASNGIIHVLGGVMLPF